MERKKLNNKVEFNACGKSIIFHLSDHELRRLKHSSIYNKDDDWEKKTYGLIYNFAVYALFDAEFSSSKYGRLVNNFPYKEFDKMMWNIINN